MSQQTSDTLDAALRAHVADETGGDIVTGWIVTAAIVEAEFDSRTTWLSVRGLAVYEQRGILVEADRMVVAIAKQSGDMR